MTDTLDQALANAGLTLLRADAGLTVYDGVVPAAATRPYVLVYTHIEWLEGAGGDALDGLSGSPTIRWICHCVGDNAVASRAVAQRVRAQLLNARPTFTPPVSGLSVGLIRQEQSIPPVRDETTGGLVMDAVNVYRLTAGT